MNCSRSVEMMHERLSGEADAGGAPFDEHLVECGRCRTHYRALLELARMATQMPEAPAPAAIRTRVAARLAPTHQAAPGDRRWVAVGIAAMLCVAAATAAFSPGVWQSGCGWLAGVGRWIGAAGSGLLAGLSDATRGVFAADRLASLGRFALTEAIPRISISVLLLVGAVVLLSVTNAMLIRYARRAI